MGCQVFFEFLRIPIRVASKTKTQLCVRKKATNFEGKPTKRERKREKACLCVCPRVRERERERERNRQRDKAVGDSNGLEQIGAESAKRYAANVFGEWVGLCFALGLSWPLLLYLPLGFLFQFVVTFYFIFVFFFRCFVSILVKGWFYHDSGCFKPPFVTLLVWKVFFRS